MAGVPYVVVRAEPLTKVEFAKTKRLTISLRRIEMLDPKEILFSLPTICGAALPKILVAAADEDRVVLHEDDWRQCEFVSICQSNDISAEIADIRKIHSEATAAVGWRNIHVRERIVQPLPAGIAWSRISGLLGKTENIGGIAFGRSENSVANALGVRFSDGVIIWGVQENGSLGALCVENLDRASDTTVAALKRVADGLSIALINWCRCQFYCRDMIIERAAGTLWETEK